MALNPNFVFTYSQTDAEIEDLFLKAMMSEGLIFDAKDLPLRMDGKTHYVKVAGRSSKNKNNRSGWYNGRFGDFPSGKFGWMHGKKPEFSWSLYRHIKENEGGIKYAVLTEEEAEQRQKRREQEQKQRLLDEKRRFDFSKALTIIEWERALPLRPHSYLHSKKLSIEECQPYVRLYNRNNYTAHECEQILKVHFPEYNKPSNIRRLMRYQEEFIKFRGFNLILRGQTIDNTPLMFQLIFNKKNNAGKNKHFPKELIKQNTFLVLGEPIGPDTKQVIICEGWATGMSILRFTQAKKTILVAWDSGNMEAVAATLRKSFPDCRIDSASDNDHTKPDADNAGLCAALRLGRAVGAYVVMPRFNSQDPLQQPLSDWNDIDLLLPPPESSAMFFSAIENAPFIDACFDEGLQLLGENESIDRRAPLQPDHSLEFKHFWISMSLLVFRGLQHCGYTQTEQMALLEKQLPFTQQTLKNHGLLEAQQHYDPSINQQVANVFFNFVNEINSSSKNPLTQSKLFSSTLTSIRTLQKVISHANLLMLLHTHLTEKLGEELALACLGLHLNQSNYFSRPTAVWYQALCSKLSGENMPLSTALALTLCTKEFDYWQLAHKFDREQAAAQDIIRASKQLGSQGTLQCSESFANQQKKLAFIFEAYHQALLQPEQKTYLLRLIERFNQTEENILKI